LTAFTKLKFQKERTVSRSEIIQGKVMTVHHDFFWISPRHPDIADDIAFCQTLQTQRLPSDRFLLMIVRLVVISDKATGILKNNRRVLPYGDPGNST
jgi:hypothetical protein